MKATPTKPSAGKILVSEPFMMDSYFQRSVVLLTEHSSEGTIGFILNKQTTVMVCDVLPGFPESDIPLYFGGPVQTDTIHFLHSLGETLEGAREVQKGIYWGGNLEQLKHMVEKKMVSNNEVRFFAGYSGWDPEQLSQELKHHTWLLYQCNKKLAFTEDPMKLWGNVLRNMGSEFAIMANFPVDPSLN